MPGDNYRNLSDGFYLEGKQRGLGRLPVVGYYTEGHIHSFIHSIHSINSFHSFIHSVVCLSTGPWPLPQPVLDRLQSSFPFSIFSILCFTEGHPEASYIFFLIFSSPVVLHHVFPSITCFRRQFLHMM